MLDSNNLLELIKRAANDANEASDPSDFCYGKVTSINPLKIFVEQRMELGRAQLVLTRNVTDFQTQISAGSVQSGGSPKHSHAIGTIAITVHNGLKLGDELILMRKRGGQKYLVLDRVVSI